MSVKSWPNGTPSSSQLKPCSQLRWINWVLFGHPLGLSWLELDQVGLNLIKLKFLRNLNHVFHRLANSRQVVLLLLCDYTAAFRQLNGFCELAQLGGVVWPPTDASFDFVTWLELAWVGSTVWPGLNMFSFCTRRGWVVVVPCAPSKERLGETTDSSGIWTRYPCPVLC